MLLNDALGASLKNQVERSFHGHLRGPEARILEDCEQLGRAGLRPERITSALRQSVLGAQPSGS